MVHMRISQAVWALVHGSAAVRGGPSHRGRKKEIGEKHCPGVEAHAANVEVLALKQGLKLASVAVLVRGGPFSAEPRGFVSQATLLVMRRAARATLKRR